MCGLTGFCDFNKKLGETALRLANCYLKHRGPDWQDAVVIETSQAHIGLAHSRLSIIDLSDKGNQPLYSRSGNTVLLYNGEVYNFMELRKELEARGHIFSSDSDSEVIVEAYEAFGINAVHRFNGMFAIVLYDSRKQRLYLLRDRSGVKPMYYSYEQGCLLFASELKSFHAYPCFKKNLSREAITLFFKYGYIRAPYSIFQNTFKLLPGSYLEMDLATGQANRIKYYDVLDKYNYPKLALSEFEAMEATRELFASSFRYRSISDVPVGIFLSGGYDSSLVTAMMQAESMQKIKTFTIGFHIPEYNEGEYAKAIAAYLGTDHHEHYCSAEEALSVLLTLPSIFDEPLGDSSAIPTVLVSHLAKTAVTVSLSADGGDELFAGYERYAELARLSRQMKLTGQQAYRDIADKAVTHYTNFELKQLLPGLDMQIGLYDDLGTIGPENDLVNTCLLLDYKTYMADDILVKVDRASMSIGLEAREPLLDHRLVEFLAQLPSGLKFHNGEKKFLLKQITHQYIPRSLLNRPKTGFTIPLSSWLKTSFRELLFDCVNEPALRRFGILDTATATKLCEDFIAGRHQNHIQVWFLLVFQMWCNKWL